MNTIKITELQELSQLGLDPCDLFVVVDVSDTSNTESNKKVTLASIVEYVGGSLPNSNTIVALDDTDVNIASLQTGHVLKFNATSGLWENTMSLDGYVGTKSVDESNIGDGFVLIYDQASDTMQYVESTLHTQNTDTGTNSNTFDIGDETAVGNKVINARINDSSTLPNIRFNVTNNKWEFSNDGDQYSTLAANVANLSFIGSVLGGVQLTAVPSAGLPIGSKYYVLTTTSSPNQAWNLPAGSIQKGSIIEKIDTNQWSVFLDTNISVNSSDLLESAVTWIQTNPAAFYKYNPSNTEWEYYQPFNLKPNASQFSIDEATNTFGLSSGISAGFTPTLHNVASATASSDVTTSVVMNDGPDNIPNITWKNFDTQEFQAAVYRIIDGPNGVGFIYEPQLYSYSTFGATKGASFSMGGGLVGWYLTDQTPSNTVTNANRTTFYIVDKYNGQPNNNTAIRVGGINVLSDSTQRGYLEYEGEPNKTYLLDNALPRWKDVTDHVFNTDNYADESVTLDKLAPEAKGQTMSIQFNSNMEQTKYLAVQATSTFEIVSIVMPGNVNNVFNLSILYDESSTLNLATNTSQANLFETLNTSVKSKQGIVELAFTLNYPSGNSGRSHIIINYVP